MLTFVKQCEVAFQQMFFNQLVQLTTALQAYIENRDYQYNKSLAHKEKAVKQTLENIEKFSLSKSGAQLRQDYAEISDHAKADSKTYLNFLVESNLHLLEHDDKNSIALMHKYYDYSMR